MKHIMKQKLPRINPTTLINSLGRFTLIATFSLGLATVKNWENYKNYWYGTIFAVQTVDFNMLSHTLPVKLSYTLLQGNIEELQRTLDSNYGFFGLIVTDCKMAAKDCLSEQILYQSKSSKKWTKEISLATLSNHPYDLLQSPPPLQVEQQYAKPRDSKPIPTGRVNSGQIIGRVYYVRGVPPTFIEDYNKWIKEPFKITGSRTLYTSTVALFFVSGLSAWIIIEVVLSAKRNEQRLAQQQQEQLRREAEYEQRLAQQQREQLQREAEYEQHLAQQQREQLQREIQQIKLELEAKNQQTIKLIKQRERGLAELESYRQEEEQNKRELENQIASYESELAFKEQQQQETVQTLEDLQLLRQKLQETSRRESEAKQQSNELNAALEGSRAELEQIKALSRDSETYLLKESLRLEEENAYLEGYRAELERIKEQSKDGENYYVGENDRLEKEKVQLNSELHLSKSRTQFLEARNRQLDRELSAAQENTQILENNIELQNLSQNSHSGIPWNQLPRISGRRAIGSLERLGFIRQDRGGGGHIVLKRVVTSSCTVPLHDELASGTLVNILRQANVTLEEFLDNL